MFASLARRDRIEVLAARIRKAELTIAQIESSDMPKDCPNLARVIISGNRARIAACLRELARI